MFVWVGEGEEVGPVFGVEACEGREDEHLFGVREGCGGGGEVVELVVYDGRWAWRGVGR